MKIKVRKLDRRIPKRIVKLIIKSQQDKSKTMTINLKDIQKHRQEYYAEKFDN